MKRRIRMGLVILIGCLSVGCQKEAGVSDAGVGGGGVGPVAPKGVEVGSAGEDCAAEFVSIGRGLIPIAQLHPDLGVDADSLARLVAEIRVECVSEVWLDGRLVDAANFASTRRIEVNRVNWAYLEDKPARQKRLVAHEYFTLLNLNDSRNQLSSRFTSENVCFRSPTIRSLLENRIGKHCSTITPMDLGTVTTLELPQDPETALVTGDLDQLFHLRTLSIRGVGLSSIPTGLFNDLEDLTALDLSFNRLTSVPDGAFRYLRNLQKLNLNGNPLSVLSGNEFQKSPYLSEVEICSKPALLSLGDGALDSLFRVKRLHLCAEFEKVSAITMLALESVEVLRLGGKGIGKIPQRVWAGLVSVREIHLTLETAPDTQWLQSMDIAVAKTVASIEIECPDAESIDKVRLQNFSIFETPRGIRLKRVHR